MRCQGRLALDSQGSAESDGVIAGLIECFQHATVVRGNLGFEFFDLQQFDIIQGSVYLVHLLSPPGTVESQIVSCQSFIFS